MSAVIAVAFLYVVVAVAAGRFFYITATEKCELSPALVFGICWPVAAMLVLVAFLRHLPTLIRESRTEASHE